MVSAEPSPQSIATVLVWMSLGLKMVPLTVTEPFSSMLDDESIKPGAANSGAGSAMSTLVWAREVKAPSESVTPTV